MVISRRRPERSREKRDLLQSSRREAFARGFRVLVCGPPSSSQALRDGFALSGRCPPSAVIFVYRTPPAGW